MAAILKWMFVLVLLIAVIGGGAAYWVYSRSDEVLRLAVLQQLRTIAPTLKFDIARANCDLMGRVRIYGLTCALPDDPDDQPSLEVPEVIATLTDFENFDNFVIQKLSIVHPKMRVTRSAAGEWNWQQATFQVTQGTPLPEVEVVHGLVESQFELPDNKGRRLRFKNFNVSAHPASSKQFLVQVATLLEPSGPLTLEIRASTDGSNWKCDSRNPWRVPVDQHLIQLMCDLSPEFAEQMRMIGKRIDEAKSLKAIAAAKGGSNHNPPQTARSQEETNGIPDLGLSCDCALTFQLIKEGRDAPVSVKARADIQKGQLHNELLAVPLDELSGTVYIDRRNIIVKDLRGISGTMQLAFDSKIVPSTPISATLKVRNVELTDAVKSRLPEGLRRIVQSLAITGKFDCDAMLVQEGGEWTPTVDLRMTQGTVTHERFPVTVREVAGQLRMDGDLVTYKVTGRYAGQLVESYGTITNPGPAHQADLVVKAKNLPLDDESLAASPAEVRAAIESLRLKCRHDLLFRLTRAAGLHNRFEPELTERIYDGSMQFTGFSYAVQKLKGIVHWKGDRIEFQDLSGVHDGTTLAGQGTYLRQPGPGRLELSIDATNAAFDRSLEIALPASLRQVWKSFQPQGFFDAKKLTITWVRGSPCQIVVPSIKVRDAEILMTFFPWSLQRLRGEFSYNTEPGKLVIKEVRAQHDDTLLSAKGTGWFASDQPWRLKFDQLDIDNLSPNFTFRNALPTGLQSTFDFLKPTGTFSFHGPAEFRELRQGDATVGAAWNLKTVLTGCAINVGTRIDEIFGEVQLNGSWDGSKTVLDGKLELDSISIFRQAKGHAYQITGIRGPISLRDNLLIVGTETAIPPRKSDNPSSDKRIRGKAIDGEVYLDAVVDLANGSNYRAFAELKGGRLESYARQYLRGRNRLAGVMNGYISMQGKGSDIDQMTGKGKLIIDQAELIDSPLFAQMFQLLKLQTPDKAAFEYAAVNFNVENSRFNLNSMELLGDTLSMRGRGYIRFDGGMQMDFGVRFRDWQWLPNNLTAYEISGTMNDPKIQSIPLRNLDGALRQFFKAFEPRPLNGRPGYFDPLTGQNGDAVNR